MKALVSSRMAQRCGWLGIFATVAGCDTAHVELLSQGNRDSSDAPGDRISTDAGPNESAAGGSGASAGPSAGAGGQAAGGQSTGGQGSGGEAGGGQAGGGQGGSAGQPSLVPCTNFGDWLPPEPVLGLESADLDHFGPSLTNQPTVLFFSVGVAEAEDIWRATRAQPGGPFTGAMAVAEVNTLNMDGTPYITPDGQALWFSSTRPGGLGDRDIWMAQGGVNGFATAVNVSELNSASLEHLPSLTADGLLAMFGSTRANSGNEDIWMATRDSISAPFEPPVFVTELNTDAYDSSPAITADGLTVYFTSKRTGDSGTDIFVATRESRSDPFGQLEAVDELNSPANDEDPRLSPAGDELFFASNRDTDTHQIWYSRRECVTTP